MKSSEILKDLNEEQRNIVKTTDGPILIVAGAGTGKTRVITRRIAYLIDKGLALPNQILALAFNRKASLEMSERVEAILGCASEDFWIMTFHAFCHRILRDHAIEAGLSPNFRLLNSIGQWVFFKSILPQIKLKHYLNPADPASVIHGFAQFISRVKDEIISPEEYKNFVLKRGRGQEKSFAEERARIYEVYQQKMKEAGLVDFGDLIIYTINLFRTRKNILDAYRKQFKYIVIDEFQDTNVAQIELATMLAPPLNNICVVGDDDQAIYRFRGASYASFIKFKTSFPKLKNLKLVQNYRSTKNILDTAETLIKHNDIDRYDPEKNLWTKNRRGKRVELHIVSDYTDEARLIINKIKMLKEEGASLKDMAILYRAHSHREDLVRLLKESRIPYDIVGGIALLETEEIRELISFLKIMQDITDSVSLFNCMAQPVFDINLPDAVKLADFAKSSGISLYEALGKIKNIKIALCIKEKVKNFKIFIEALIASSFKEDADIFLHKLLEKTQILKNLIFCPTQENEEKILNITRFLKIATRFANESNKRDTASFVQYLNSYIEAGGVLEAESETLGAVPDSIKLMTIHQAKGLEFEHVFVVSLVENRFPTRQRPEEIEFPIELIKEKLPRGNFHEEEERRLFYVAMTRAKTSLSITSVSKPYHKPSRFVSEIQKSEKTLVCQSDLDPATRSPLAKLPMPIAGIDEKKAKFIKSVASKITNLEEVVKNEKRLKEVAGDINKDFFVLAAGIAKAKEKKLGFGEEAKKDISETTIPIPENLELSYTQIDTYLECPLKYKFGYIYKIPTRPSPQLEFGQVIHNVLRDFFVLVQKHERADYETLKKIYKKTWRGEAFRNRLQESAYKKEGFRNLRGFFNLNKDRMIPPLFIEKNFLFKIGRHSVKGYIDRIDQYDNGMVEIIDYKTGKTRLKDSTQLNIYAMGAAKALNLDVSKLSFYYLSTNEKTSFDMGEIDLAKTESSIRDVIANIESGSFQPRPSYHKCKWCEFNILCPSAAYR